MDFHLQYKSQGLTYRRILSMKKQSQFHNHQKHIKFFEDSPISNTKQHTKDPRQNTVRFNLNALEPTYKYKVTKQNSKSTNSAFGQYYQNVPLSSSANIQPKQKNVQKVQKVSEQRNSRLKKPSSIKKQIQYARKIQQQSTSNCALITAYQTKDIIHKKIEQINIMQMILTNMSSQIHRSTQILKKKSKQNRNKLYCPQIQQNKKTVYTNIKLAKFVQFPKLQYRLGGMGQGAVNLSGLSQKIRRLY